MDAASGARGAQPVIEVREVSKEYGSLRALDRVSFTVSPARVVGVLGPNGAGKTTLLGCIVGLVRPSSGQVLLAGGLPGRPQRVGLLPERPGLHPRLSPWTQLRWWTSVLGLGGEAARPLLQLVGLEHVANRPTRRLSLGERQRLGLACALAGDPQVLVLDEPAAGLDPAGIRWLAGLLRSLAAEGRTVLLSSHILSEVERTADEIVILHRGRVRFQGTVSEIPSLEVVVLEGGEDAVRRTAALLGPEQIPFRIHGPGRLEVLGSGPLGPLDGLRIVARRPADLETVFFFHTEGP